jgi:hypothetical protein
MGKYDPLRAFLLSSNAEEVPLSFEEIEALLGAPLPPSQKHPAWWSNNPTNNTMTRMWLEAGYRTERLDVDGRKVVFRRAAARKGDDGTERVLSIVDRVRAALAGTVRVQSGYDLTSPTGEHWDAQDS